MIKSLSMKPLIALACLAFLVAGCDIANDDALVPVPAGPAIGGGSSTAVRPAPSPMAPAIPNTAAIEDNLYNIPGVREIHAVREPENCRQMAERFKREGRNIRLVRIRDLKTGDLPTQCIFEGPDAEANYWEDRRYERPDSTNGGT